MIYRISNFDEGPHYDVAFIEADTEVQAVGKLLSLLQDEDFRDGHEVWAGPEYITSNWRVQEVERPLAFVLGGGCR